MTARHLCAALAALFLSFLPDSALSGPKVQIRDDQYSGFISGASFVAGCTSVTGHYVELDPPEWYNDDDWPEDESQTPAGWPTNWLEIIDNWEWSKWVTVTNHIAAPWSGTNETWTADGGFSTHYWPSTSELARVSYDGKQWRTVMDAWRRTSQPTVYGATASNSYVNLYQSEVGNSAGAGFLSVCAKPAEEIACNAASDGAAVEVDDLLFFDAMVALSPHFPGDSNRPSVATDHPAKVALYLQRNQGSSYPQLYVVARDWGTGEVMHYPVSCTFDAASAGTSGDTLYCARVTVCFVRDIYGGDGTTQGVAVYVNGEPAYYSVDPRDIQAPIDFARVRADLRLTYGYVPYNATWSGCLCVFRPLSEGNPVPHTTGVSYRGSLLLGAYTVSRANPLSATATWSAWASRMRALYLDSGSVDVNAGYKSWFPVLNQASPYGMSLAWYGSGGWADEYHMAYPGGGCTVSLDETCFRHGVASLSAAEGLSDEEWAELERRGLPHAASRTGSLYADIGEAASHVAVLGGEITLLADPGSDIAIAGITNGVTVKTATRASVNSVVSTAGSGADAALTVAGGRFSAGVSVSGIPFYTRREFADGYWRDCSFGGLVGVYDSTNAEINSAYAYAGLYATNSSVAIKAGHYYAGTYEHAAGMPGIAVLVDGGDLFIGSGTYFQDGRVEVRSTSPVSITGGEFDELDLIACDIEQLEPSSCTVLVVSNSVSPIVLSGYTQDARFTDVGDVFVESDTSRVAADGAWLFMVGDGISVDDLCASNVESMVFLPGSHVAGTATVAASNVTASGTSFADVAFTGTGAAAASDSAFSAAASFSGYAVLSMSNATFSAGADIAGCSVVETRGFSLELSWSEDPTFMTVRGGRVDVHGGNARNLYVLDGELNIYDAECSLPGASPGDLVMVASNSTVAVYGGRVSYPRGGWADSYGDTFGNFYTYDSPVTITGGEFARLVSTGAAPVSIQGAVFHNGVEISGATTVAVSGGSVVDDRYSMRYGSTHISATESILISGAPAFSLDVTLSAPVVDISGGTFTRGNVEISSASATITGGTFDGFCPSMATASYNAGHRITVSGGKFAGNPTTVYGVVIAPGKSVVKSGDYYEVR